MSSPESIALVGLKGSGKTTFLAALWHLMEAQESSTRLRARKLQPDREYLNNIRENWLKFESVSRTQLKNEKRVDLLLERDIGNDSIDLSFPDVSGESYRIQWSLRRARREYVDLIRAVKGILLFVHPQQIVRPERIPMGRSLDAPVSVSPVSIPQKKWSADSTPTQVQLVEVLQFVRHLQHSERRTPVGVLVSAWDTLCEREAPASWIERRLPLLSQYLCANTRFMPATVFGVSAQGGSYESDRNELMKKRVASERIQIHGMDGDDLGHDLTLPLEFALGSEVAPLLTLDNGRA